MDTDVQRIYRYHPARRATRCPAALPPSPVNSQREHTPRRTQRRESHAYIPSRPHPAPRRKPRGRLGRWRWLIWLALAVPGALWLYAQAPRLFPFAARHGIDPGLLLLPGCSCTCFFLLLRRCKRDRPVDRGLEIVYSPLRLARLVLPGLAF